jgi:transcriptional regulator
MYQPPAFRETDKHVLHAFIAAHPLGLLTSSNGAALVADQIPFLLYPEEGAFGTLRAHLARANPQWLMLDDPATLHLVVFSGVNHYVSPSWYPQKAVDGKVVPTWNYAVVQAKGHLTIHQDPAWLHAHVSALTDRHESGRTSPWAVSDAPDAFVASQLKGIVGIEIAIDILEGKLKASQNRAEADRTGVAEGLSAETDAAAPAMRELVKARGGI